MGFAKGKALFAPLNRWKQLLYTLEEKQALLHTLTMCMLASRTTNGTQELLDDFCLWHKLDFDTVITVPVWHKITPCISLFPVDCMSALFILSLFPESSPSPLFTLNLVNIFTAYSFTKNQGSVHSLNYFRLPV